MILIDANLLLYVKFADFPQYAAAREWLEEQLNPLSTRAAWQQVVDWLSHPRVWIPEPTEEHPTTLGALLGDTHATGNLVPDAHLAAIAIEHGLTLCSADSDFGRFPRVEWRNPLAPS